MNCEVLKKVDRGEGGRTFKIANYYKISKFLKQDVNSRN